MSGTIFLCRYYGDRDTSTWKPLGTIREYCLVRLFRARICPALATAVGVTGFVTLLVGGSSIPDAATHLRILAFIWSFGFGIAKVALWRLRARRSEPEGERSANRLLE